MQINQNHLAKWTNNELEKELREKSALERKLSIEVIELLEEMDRRKLYLARGYGSLIAYCVKELKYSESSAYRRVAAMRVTREIPETKEKLQDGTLNLASVAQAQSFFKGEAQNKKPLSVTDKKVVLESLSGKSSRESEKILADLSPEAVRKDKVRVIGGGRREITFTVDESFFEKLEKVKNRLSHTIPGGEISKIIEHMLDREIRKLEPRSRECDPRHNEHEPRSEAAESRQCKKGAKKLVGVAEASRDAAPAPVLERVKKEVTVVTTGAAPAATAVAAAETATAAAATTATAETVTAPETTTARSGRSRYVSVHVKREVWRRAKGQCCFVDDRSGKRCSSTRFLELDHIWPHSRGGTATLQNLQLLCDAHNRQKSDGA